MAEPEEPRSQDDEQRYRALILSMAEGVVMHDAEGRIVTCNPAAENILGLGLDELRGLTARDPRWEAIRADGTPIPPEEHPSTITRVTGEPVRNRVIGVRRPDGTLVWTQVNTEPLVRAPGERPFGVVISFADITLLRRTIEELTEALRTLRKLTGLLPICAHCKKIRDDRGYWQQIETFIHAHSGAEFSHGVCPDCASVHYPANE